MMMSLRGGSQPGRPKGGRGAGDCDAREKLSFDSALKAAELESLSSGCLRLAGGGDSGGRSHSVTARAGVMEAVGIGGVGASWHPSPSLAEPEPRTSKSG
eukprot:3939038-Rhodomonas_salina.1